MTRLRTAVLLALMALAALPLAGCGGGDEPAGHDHKDDDGHDHSKEAK